jgi:DNA-binding NarL/FixJ family response regulator
MVCIYLSYSSVAARARRAHSVRTSPRTAKVARSSPLAERDVLHHASLTGRAACSSITRMSRPDEPPTTARRFNLDGVDVYVFVHGADPAMEDSTLKEEDKTLVSLLESGLGNREIALRVGASDAAVRRRLERLYKRLGVASRAELVALIQERRAPS